MVTQPPILAKPRSQVKSRLTTNHHPISKFRSTTKLQPIPHPQSSPAAYTATVSSVGQITIPSAIREQLGLTPGTKLDLTLDPDTTSLTISKQKNLDDVLAELDEIDKKYPTPPPDPRARHMTVGEMALELLSQPKKGDPDTWV